MKINLFYKLSFNFKNFFHTQNRLLQYIKNKIYIIKTRS